MPDIILGRQTAVAGPVRVHDADLIGRLVLVYLTGENDVSGRPILC